MSTGKDMTIGIIGAGNMGGAIAAGLTTTMPGTHVAIHDSLPEKLARFSQIPGIRLYDSAVSLAGEVDILILAVKPGDIPPLLESIHSTTRAEAVVSVAAGVTLESLAAHLGIDLPIIRAMPNTPALVSAGMTVLSPGDGVPLPVLEAVKDIFSTLGRVIVLPEKHMDAVTGLSGSGPAYVFTFIQALADGGVLVGLPRDVALELAAQTVLGAARMVLEGRESPLLLRDRVASPGGTTIAGIYALERDGFSGTVMDAVQAATERSRELG